MGDMLHDMSLEALVEAIEGNLFALFKSFGVLPGAEVYDEDDVLRFLTGIGSPMFNGVARAHFSPSGDLMEKIEEQLAPFRERNLPAFWWTGLTTQPVDLDELLLEAGMEENFVDAPGMAADLFAIDTRRMDYVGTRHDPLSLIAKVGIGAPADMTMINGRIVWQKGEFAGLDEGRLFAEAEAALAAVNL